MSTTANLRLTNDDVATMPDDGNRYELIDGELYVSSAPSFIHQTILTRILVAFSIYLNEHPMGAIVPGVGVIFDDYNGVIPDLVFATHTCMRKTLVGGRFHAAPEIVIEIMSPGSSNERRDRHVKRSLYAARGVEEYWIVDPDDRSVGIHRRDEAGDLILAESLRQGDSLTCAILPGFSAPLDSLFI